ncbi:hypothetical protein BDY21DRAFT_305613, partial [Lineolata rhizophorae]
MLRKKEVYTNITPIPSHIPRQLAIDILHSHAEIITLNPLVLEHNAIKAPRDAAADEFYSTWYEIIERIQYVPGMGRMGSGKISFRGCFHDTPWGLQTHIYAPMNVDLRNNWRIAGNQPGEPPEPKELGVKAPAEGLYLREDIEIKCNVAMVGFVKSQLKAASKILVDRLIKKAELLDAGVLHAMMENGRLKTFNPHDKSAGGGGGSGGPNRSNTMMSMAMSDAGGCPPGQMPLSPSMPYKVPRSPTFAYNQPSADPNYAHYQHHQSEQHAPPPQQFAMELPGDFYHPTPPPQQQHSPAPGNGSDYGGNGGGGGHRTSSPHLSSRDSAYTSVSDSPDPNNASGRWSEYQSGGSSVGAASSRPTSYSSDASGFRSPGPHKSSFAAELPTTTEESGREEEEQNQRYHDDGGQAAALKRLEGNRGAAVRPGSVEPERRYRYNPQDFAGVG